MDDRPPISYESPAPSRLRTWRDDFSADWARFTAGFTRENVISNAKTLAWVIPLTLLIWIFAEREQVATSKDEPIPFELHNPSPDRAVALRFPQDRNLMLELQGPQARLQAVLSRLRGGQMPQGLKIEIPPTLELNRETTLPTLPLVRQQRIFSENGITVLAVQPPHLQVMVDQMVDRDATVIVPPDVKNLEATFDPPTVKVHGPLTELVRAEQAMRARGTPGGLMVWADLSGVQNKQPGQYPLSSVGVRRPPELEDEQITILPPTTVRANVEVKQAEQTLLIRSMPIYVDWPEGLWRKYDVILERPAIPNVTVTGPPDLIEAMQRPDFEPKPRARLSVTQQDAGEQRRSKPVKFDLPDGVRVVDEDRNRTAEFRMVDRASLSPSI